LIIYYFSGTGNSYWTAKEIGEHFTADVHSITEYMSKTMSEAPIAVDDNVLGIVCPTYMSDIPWIVRDFLLKLSSERKPYVFAVMTSNHGDSGKGFTSIDTVLSASGMALTLAFDLQMPGNCVESTAEQDRERLEQAPGKVNGFSKSIEDREINFTPNQQAKDWKKSSLYSVMTHFQVKKNCTGCGVCAKLCPTRNITISDGKTIHGKNCAACYACVHWCPEHATIVDVPTFKNLRQYHHPDVAMENMVRDTAR